LWHSKAKCSLTNDCREDLRIIRQLLRDTSVDWSTPIAVLVPRTPHYQLYGDASRLAGAAYCMRLQYWFIVQWSSAVCTGLQKHRSDPGFVHINSLEFIVLILQVVATLVALSDPSVVQATLSLLSRSFRFILTILRQKHGPANFVPGPMLARICSVFMQRFCGMCRWVLLVNTLLVSITDWLIFYLYLLTPMLLFRRILTSSFRGIPR
jgi:hypothetical protein